MLLRILNRFAREYNGMVLRKSMKMFGHNSILKKPYMLTNPEHIVIENNVFIREYSRIEAITDAGGRKYSPTLIIRKGTQIEQFFHVGACEHVEICENVLIAGRVYISDHNHAFDNPDTPIIAQGIKSGGKVVIEPNCWLGEGCVILPGVTIGKNSIIGANAVVSKNIPPYSIAVGAPAKTIKTYDFTNNAWTSI